MTTSNHRMDPRDALGVAKRALENLDLIKDHEGYHVTGIVSTALAVLIFPWEEHLRGDHESIHEIAGSALWKVDPTSQESGNTLRHVRNALAHGRIKFDSTSREPSEVHIRFSDRRSGASDNWFASIRADLLEQYLRSLYPQLADRFD